MSKKQSKVLGIAEARIYGVSYVDESGTNQASPVLVIGGNVCLPADGQFVWEDPASTPKYLVDGVLGAIAEADGGQQV